jgi:hypothetical protein
MKNDYTDLITVKGLVVPTKWDNDGNVIGIAIAQNNEMEFPVLMNGIGRNLIDLLHEKVVIRGKKVQTDNIDEIEVNSFDKDSV